MIIDSDQPIGNQSEIETLVSTLDPTKYLLLPTIGWYAYGPRALRHEANRADPAHLPFATLKFVRDANGSSAERLPELVEQVTPQGTNLDNNSTDMLTRILLRPRLTLGQFDGTAKALLYLALPGLASLFPW